MIDATAKALTDEGEVILAHHRMNQTLHSSGQIEHCQNKACDRSIKAGG